MNERSMNKGIEEIAGDAKIDCLDFGGYMPCSRHKETGVHCDECHDYRKAGKNILIIKLGAAGEVLRNTPLLRRLKLEFANPKIFWLTKCPEMVPEHEVFRVYSLSHESAELMRDIEFEVLYSLDKHEESAAIANQIKARVKKGFSQQNGRLVPFDKDAMHKWRTGIFDDEMRANRKHYVEEIFEMCGFDFRGEEYVLPKFEVPKLEMRLNSDRRIVALNTGASSVWLPRIPSEKYWAELANMLGEEGYEVMVVGGPIEHEKNQRIARSTSAKYPGHFPYRQSIGLLSLADAVVTPVTFALHAAIGLQKKVVLLNNVFNKSEFHLYDRGAILEPELDCLGCYKNDQDEKCPAQNCMDTVKQERIAGEIRRLCG